jgi:Mor family transcriptional regulator
VSIAFAFPEQEIKYKESKMSYKKAVYILPGDLLERVQEYIDGEFLYIPRKSGTKKEWGSQTSARKELRQRNMLIYKDFIAGNSSQELSEKYFLSMKSIQRILREQRGIN